MLRFAEQHVLYGFPGGVALSVTQKQIADRLGMSRQQVGLALAGKGTVSAATRQRVLEAAQALGYDLHSNREARTLIARRYGKRVVHGTLALLFPPIGAIRADVELLRASPFFTPYFEGAEQEAARRDLDMLLCSARATGLPRLIREKGVDGVIGVGVPTELKQVRDLGLSAVALGFQSEAAISLVPDDREGMRRMTRHLLELGHRRIAYLHFPDPVAGSARLAGYHEAFAEFGAPMPDASLTVTATEMFREAGAVTAGELLRREQPFTALLCYNDLLCMGAGDHLRAEGIRIPEQVSLAGFDDVATEYAYDLPLTSVHFDRYAMGRRAVEILCDQNPAEVSTLTVERFPVEIAARASVRALI